MRMTQEEETRAYASSAATKAERERIIAIINDTKTPGRFIEKAKLIRAIEKDQW